jgi:hypothetical protein
MFTDIKNYIKSCDLCQRNKSSNQAPAGLLQPLPIPAKKWEQISMDFIVQLPLTPSGHDAIVVFVDRLTKTVKMEPTKTNATAPDIAHIFFRTIFRNFGLPRVIVCDRDPKFTSHFWQALFKTMGTQINMSTAFHPQTDGQTERTNRTLEQMLRNYVTYKQDNWDTQLIFAEFACNNAIQASTKFSPFRLLYGQDPDTPASLLAYQNKNVTHVPAAQDMISTMEHELKLASEYLVQAQQKQVKYANMKRRDVHFKIGDYVLLSTKNLNLASQVNRPSRKLQEKFIGPYEIIEQVSPMAYKLDLPGTIRIHPVFHVSLLKEYKATPEKYKNRTVQPSAPVLIDDHIEYEVEKILDKRNFRKRTEYLVKWAGYPEYDATWEPLRNLANAQEVIHEYENSH